MNSHSSPMVGRRSWFHLVSGFGNHSWRSQEVYVASRVAISYSAAAARVLQVYMVLIYKITDVCTIFKTYGYGNHHPVICMYDPSY